MWSQNRNHSQRLGEVGKTSSHSKETVAREQQQEAGAQGRAQGLETGWIVVSYLLAGMAAYGGIGWLIGHAVHVPVLFPVGMMVGLGISLGYIIYRFGRQQVAERPRKEMTGDR